MSDSYIALIHTKTIDRLFVYTIVWCHHIYPHACIILMLDHFPGLECVIPPIYEALHQDYFPGLITYRNNAARYVAVPTRHRRYDHGLILSVSIHCYH